MKSLLTNLEEKDGLIIFSWSDSMFLRISLEFRYLPILLSLSAYVHTWVGQCGQ